MLIVETGEDMRGVNTDNNQEVLKGIISGWHGSFHIFSINQIKHIPESLVVTDNALTGSDSIAPLSLSARMRNNTPSDAGEGRLHDNGNVPAPDVSRFSVTVLKFLNGVKPEGERCFLHPSLLSHISDIFPALLKGRTSVPGHLYLVFPVALPLLNTFPACLNINICGIPQMLPRAPPCHSLETNDNLFHITLLI